jgi:hypothetical protein
MQGKQGQRDRRTTTKHTTWAPGATRLCMSGFADMARVTNRRNRERIRLPYEFDLCKLLYL